MKEIGVEEHNGDVSFRLEVEIRPFRSCAMHPAIITGTVRSLWTWLWGRYYVPQNVCPVLTLDLTFTTFYSKVIIQRSVSPPYSSGLYPFISLKKFPVNCFRAP